MRASGVYRFGGVELDTLVGSLSRDGRTLALEPRAFDLLVHLVGRRGELLGHDDLLSVVWGDINVTPHSLTQAISQIRQVLQDNPRSPMFIETAHRRGYRFVAPVDVVSAGGAAAGESSKRLPYPTTRLIGRDALLADLAGRAANCRLLTLIGAGGVGKTQLALEMGRRVEHLFEDGAIFADLAAEREASSVVRTVARLLRIVPGAGADAVDAVVAGIGRAQVLILLDNCEHLAAACGELAAAVMARCPRASVLATSQLPLGAAGEALVRVPPLDVPSDDWVPSGDPRGWPDAVSLFAVRSAAVNPDFAVTVANAGAVGDVCRRLDGIPLAIELAAARTNVLSASQIAEHLHERLELLTLSRPVEPPRHQSLSATLEWSAKLLPPRLHQLLDRLAVFSGGWTIDALYAVAGDGGQAIDDLGVLVDRSLVVADVGRPEARYRLLESIRLYARHRLLAAKEYPSIRMRHLEYFCALAERINERVGRDPVACLRRMREESANLRDAFAWSLETAGAETGLRLAAAMRWVWRLEGAYVESCAWLEGALAAAPEAPPLLRARARLALGMMLHHRAEFQAARASIEGGLADLPPDERWERTYGTILLAFNETLGGSRSRANSIAAGAERDARALNDSRLVGFALIRQAVATGLAGRHARAAGLLTDACDVLRDQQDPFLLSYATVNLGLQRYLAGSLAVARDEFRESLRIACELDNRRAVGATIEGSAYLASAAGDHRWAARLLGAAARLRGMTAAPLFAHWRPTHERVMRTVRDRLGRAIAERELNAGAETPAQTLVDRLLAG